MFTLASTARPSRDFWSWLFHGLSGQQFHPPPPLQFKAKDVFSTSRRETFVCSKSSISYIFIKTTSSKADGRNQKLCRQKRAAAALQDRRHQQRTTQEVLFVKGLLVSKQTHTHTQIKTLSTLWNPDWTRVGGDEVQRETQRALVLTSLFI